MESDILRDLSTPELIKALDDFDVNELFREEYGRNKEEIREEQEPNKEISAQDYFAKPKQIWKVKQKHDRVKCLSCSNKCSHCKAANAVIHHRQELIVNQIKVLLDQLIK